MAFSSKGITHRSTATGRRGMIASAHPLASLAGMRILMEGGNAVDAAIATAAALNVVEPYMSGIGGVGYLHIYSAREKEHKIVDYVGLTPRAATLSLYDSEDKQGLGPLSPLVPGACGGWLAALERYGSMEAARVFAPAIEYAEQGYALTVKNAYFYAGAAASLRRFKTGADTYLLDGAAPEPGEVVVQKALAETFRQVAAEGADTFYRGAIADRIVRYMEETGGLITKQDLADFAPAFADPISINYRGCEVFAPPPPCQAVQYLETLAIMEGFDVAGLGHNTAPTLHRFIEATKLAMADRIAYAAIDDPPTAGLLSKDYAAERRALIGDKAQFTAGEHLVPGGPVGEVKAGDRARVDERMHDPFRHHRRRWQRRRLHPELGWRLWLVHGGAGDRHCPQQLHALVRPRAYQPQCHWPGQEKRDVRLAGPDLGRQRPAPAHRHPGELWHPPDYPADDYEHSRSPDECPSRH